MTFEPIPPEGRGGWGATLFALHLWCFVFLCASGFISDIKILPSPCWETKRNCHQRRDAARFCSRRNCKDGRCVYVCAWVRVVCFHSSVQINPTDLPNDLIPDPLHKSFCGIFDNSFQLSFLIIIPITEHTHINPAPLSLLSGTLLLCLAEWPHRSHQLPSRTRTHTPPQWWAVSFSYRTALHNTHTHIHRPLLQVPCAGMTVWRKQNDAHTAFTCTWCWMTSASLPIAPKSGKPQQYRHTKAIPLPQSTPTFPKWMLHQFLKLLYLCCV